MSDFYDPLGRKMTMWEWSAIFERGDVGLLRERHIGDTPCLFGLLWVSTVWLGLDHSFGNGPPLIFETMVFPRWRPRDLQAQRYHTIEEAVAGHWDMVRRTRRWGWWWLISERR